MAVMNRRFSLLDSRTNNLFKIETPLTVNPAGIVETRRLEIVREKCTLTKPTFIYSAIVLLHRANTLVSTIGVDALGARVAGVPSLDRLIVALVYVQALRSLCAVV